MRNEMKWYHNEKKEDEFDYEWADHYMAIFDERNISMRGHAVFWSVDKHVQNWVHNKAASDPEGLEIDIFERVSNLIIIIKITSKLNNNHIFIVG